jgi:hypothetical protein
MTDNQGQGEGQGDGQGQGQGQGDGKGPTLGELATRVDGLASKVDALITTISSSNSGQAGGGDGKSDAAAAAGDLQSQVQAEIAKIRDAEAAEAAARGERDWRAKVDEFMGRHAEAAPVEPQRGLRGVLQRGLIGTPREQRERQAAPPVPPAAPPGGGGKR